MVGVITNLVVQSSSSRETDRKSNKIFDRDALKIMSEKPREHRNIPTEALEEVSKRV